VYFLYYGVCPTNEPFITMNMKASMKPTSKKNKDTLDMDWIQEEEHLRNSKELLQKQLLEQVCIRVVFVDSESNVITDTSFKQRLTMDVEKQQSILSNTLLLQCIQTAKTEYCENAYNEVRARMNDLRRCSRNNRRWFTIEGYCESMDDVSVSFSVMDVLLWNVDVETDHLQKYVETLPPEWIGREFIKGNVFEDIVFAPSLCIFHSIQSVYVFLRVSFRKNTFDAPVISSAAKKYTRRRR
jgi:hypothetical protein